MASTNRWAEYETGTLTPPAVVQHDTLYEGTPKEEHLIWVWTGVSIRGPFSRSVYSSEVETETIEIAQGLDLPAETFTIVGEDGTTIEGEI